MGFLDFINNFIDEVKNTIHGEDFSCAHCICCRQSIKTTTKGKIRIFTCPFVNDLREEYLTEVLPTYTKETAEQYLKAYLEQSSYIYSYRANLNAFTIDDASKPLLNSSSLPIFSHEELKNRFDVFTCNQFRPYIDNNIAIYNPDLFTPMGDIYNDYIDFYSLKKEDQIAIMGRSDF